LEIYGLTGKTDVEILKKRKCGDESEKANHMYYCETVAFEPNNATLPVV